MLVTSCQTTNLSLEDSPFYIIPVGSTLKLNRELIFPPNKLSVYIQYAKIKTQWEIEKFSAHCKLELLEKKSSAQVIKPDSFTVMKSSFDTLGKKTKPLTYASVDVAELLRTEAALSYVSFSVILYLTSKTQNNIFRLICINWDDPHTGEYLNVNEIRGILGPIMTLQINDPKAKPVKELRDNSDKI